MIEALIWAGTIFIGATVLYLGWKAYKFVDLSDKFGKETSALNAQIQELIAASGRKDLLLSKGSQALGMAIAKHQELVQENIALHSSLEFQIAQYEKLQNQKISSEVRTGRIAEQLSPFLEGYPRPAATARFIGEPVDFIHFDDDKVTFVEVKSGRAQLSKKQRHIRDLINEGQVEFVVYRVSGDGPEEDENGKDKS